jgi:FKBP-type peptidyl-prolyl cis-trans isomerase
VQLALKFVHSRNTLNYTKTLLSKYETQTKGSPMSNEGKKVRTHYVGTFDDGTVFDSSVERGEPLEFECMAGMMIPGFDAAVKDMEVGETKNVHIPAVDA